LIHIIAPAADRDLILHRQHILKQALPSLGQTTPGMMMQTTDQQIAHEAKATEAAQPILPSAKFRNTLPILMDYLPVLDKADFPLLWHQWANASKHQEFSIL
jgi:hypothetical protein